VITRVVVVLFALAGMAGTAHAQRGVNIERLTLALDHQGFIGIQATRTPGPGRWNFGIFASYQIDPLVVRDPDADIIAHRVTSNALFQIGIGPRAAFGVDVPLVLYQETFDAPLGDGLGTIPTSVASDPRISLRYRFLGEGAEIERERNEGEGVALEAALRAPLGTDGSFASEKGPIAEFHLLGDFHIFGAGVGAMLGTRIRFEQERVLGTLFEHEIDFGLALKLPIPVTQDFLGILEVRGATPTYDFMGSQTSLEGDLGLRFTRGDFSVNGIVGTGFTGAAGTPSLRAMLGLYWSPRVRDADGDQIPDDRDQCAYLPEDFDGFEDSDGCLDPDNDDDLIPDADDRCPNEGAEEFHDEDEDGCTDPVNDRDGDGVVDGGDACPMQPEDMDDHQDEDGCPEPDNDADDLADANDQCPNDPEDRDGFEDSDGCPEPDNDRDGILDADDQCPVDAEDRDEHDDADGCPDPDDDHDGVLDANDRCPNEAEVINGVTDDDGCRDTGGRALFRRTGDATAPNVEVAGNVAFAASDTLAASAGPALDQLARHVIALSPHRVRIAIGADSEARRAALLRALVERGAAESRLEIVSDPSVRGARVVVTRAQVAEPSAQAPTPAPAE
jgi:hypothetical protein